MKNGDDARGIVCRESSPTPANVVSSLLAPTLAGGQPELRFLHPGFARLGDSGRLLAGLFHAAFRPKEGTGSSTQIVSGI